MPQLSKRPLSQIGVYVNYQDCSLLSKIAAMFLQKMSSRCDSVILAPMTFPTPPSIVISVPKSSRSGPSSLTAISIMPSSITLPLVSRYTLGL